MSGSPEILAGIHRILQNDGYAVFTTASLIAIQLLVAIWILVKTVVPLSRATRRLKSFCASVRSSTVETAGRKVLAEYPKLAEAWKAIHSKGGTASPDADSIDPHEAFEPSNLLPANYNPRLDAAAPGLFTAIGIVGTFLGLILGFIRVDPAEATTSVGPLLGGMVVAFCNSFVGVSLSIVWTYVSRSARHGFDVASQNVADSVGYRIQRLGPAEQMLAFLSALSQSAQASVAYSESGFRAVVDNLERLRESTERASQQLLDNLSSKLGDSLQAMVSMPFDRLNASVVRFDEVVQQTSARQEEIKNRLDAAVVRLTEAESGLITGINLAKECVEEFSIATLQLREGATAAEGLVDKTQAAAVAIGQSAEEVQRAATRYDEVATALQATNTSIIDATGALSSTASTFAGSTEHLERAVATLAKASDETVGQSVLAVRRELEIAIKNLVEGIAGSSADTIRAYQESSGKVVAVVDERMSDLTDRLSAELTTLAGRLPAEVESLNATMNQIRAQIQKATRSMDEAVNQLAHRTPEALRAQLDAYDHALATAMDHFSGTLQQWDGKLVAIEKLTLALTKTAPANPPTAMMPPAPALST